MIRMRTLLLIAICVVGCDDALKSGVDDAAPVDIADTGSPDTKSPDIVGIDTDVSDLQVADAEPDVSPPPGLCPAEKRPCLVPPEEALATYREWNGFEYFSTCFRPSLTDHDGDGLLDFGITCEQSIISQSLQYTKIIHGPFAGPYEQQSPGTTITFDYGTNTGHLYGRTVGDLDGDGVVDYVTRTPDGGHLIRWGPLLAVEPFGSTTPIVGPMGTEILRVNPAGDVNDDGVADLFVASTSSDGGFRYSVVTGPFSPSSPPSLNNPWLSLDSATRIFRFGATKDIDGDGIGELVLGDADVLTFRMSADDSLVEFRSQSRNIDTHETGDFDGDGHGDIALGSAVSRDGTNLDGRVYIFFGPHAASQTVDTAHVRLDGEPRSRFGDGMATLGDLDGDGADEIAIGAPGDSNGTGARGRVYIASIGRNTVTIDAGWPILLPADSSDFGKEVSLDGTEDKHYVTVGASALIQDPDTLMSWPGTALYIYSTEAISGF